MNNSRRKRKFNQPSDRAVGAAAWAWRMSLGILPLILFLSSGCHSPENTSENPEQAAVISAEKTTPERKDPCPLTRFGEKGKVGFLDCNGKVVSPARFDIADEYNPAFGIVRVQFGQKKGVMNAAGKVTLNPEYDFLEVIGDHRIAILDTARHGFYFCNEKGEVLQAQGFNPVYPMEEGIFLGNLADELWGMDRDGEVKFKLSNAYPQQKILPGIVSHGRIGVISGKKVGLFDVDGNLVAPTIYDSIGAFQDGRAMVVKGRKIGFIDLNGDEVIPVVYEQGYTFDGGFTTVLDQQDPDTEGWTILDREGKLATGNQFVFLGPVQFGVIWAFRPPRYGLVNTQGYGVGLPVYDAMGLALDEPPFITMKEEKVGGVAPDGTEPVPFEFDYIEPFRDGVALARKGQTEGIIDNTGNWLAELPLGKAFYRENDLFIHLAADGKSASYLNLKGEVVFSTDSP